MMVIIVLETLAEEEADDGRPISPPPKTNKSSLLDRRDPHSPR